MAISMSLPRLSSQRRSPCRRSLRRRSCHYQPSETPPIKHHLFHSSDRLPCWGFTHGVVLPLIGMAPGSNLDDRSVPSFLNRLYNRRRELLLPSPAKFAGSSQAPQPCALSAPPSPNWAVRSSMVANTSAALNERETEIVERAGATSLFFLLLFETHGARSWVTQ